jgi:zinc transport system substrate-binding protein
VVAAAYPLAWAAHQVGGRRVAVQNLTPAGAEPHDLELSTAQRDAVEDADVVLVLGEGFQPAVEAAASRRDGITVAVLERLRLGAAHDPPVWLDPRLMIDIVDEVADALRTAHPGARAAFARRAAATNDTLAALDRRYRDGLADCRQDTIVTSHEAFGHLAEAYGLRQEGVAGIAPDAEPDPRRLGELADLVRERGITTVFTEELVSPRIAQTLAREAGGVRTAVLNPLEGLTARELRAHDDYVSVMDANLVTLRTALECA